MAEETAQRAVDRAAEIMGYYGTMIGEYDESNLRDLLTDLMLLCDAEGFDFANELRIATDNYDAEAE